MIIPPVLFQMDIENFRSHAIYLHGDQTYGSKPYGYHLALVEHYLVSSNYNEYKYRASGWLHDTIEDTDYSKDRCEQDYGKEVAEIVWACSGIGVNRKERNASIYQKLKAYPDAAPVKVADRIINTKWSYLNKSVQLSKYIKEFPEFSENIRPLMTATTRGALLWNRLEDVTANAIRG